MIRVPQCQDGWQISSWGFWFLFAVNVESWHPAGHLWSQPTALFWRAGALVPDSEFDAVLACMSTVACRSWMRSCVETGPQSLIRRCTLATTSVSRYGCVSHHAAATPPAATLIEAAGALTSAVSWRRRSNGICARGGQGKIDFESAFAEDSARQWVCGLVRLLRTVTDEAVVVAWLALCDSW